jgi:hypothetical protein
MQTRLIYRLMRLPLKEIASLQSFVSALLMMLFITFGVAGSTQSTLDGGSISNPSQTIYPGSTPAQITATAASGVGAPGCDEFYQYQWQISTDNVNFTNIAGATQINYQPGPVSQTTYFRRRVTHCGTTAYTYNNATITIDNTLLQAGCINADTVFVKINTILPSPIDATQANFPCAGSYTYQWQVSTDNEYFTDVPGATGEDLNYTQPVTTTLFFIRKAKCGSITKYTSSVVVYPVYTACADFGLSLAGTSGNALATIKAGLVTTTTSSTIGEFVIEWYKDVVDETPEFVSGSAGATDPAVTVSHPFNGEPAEGGTWHPVIKYVYIDGIKYSRNYIAGVRHSPDLLHCLDPIIVIVNNLSCVNGGTYTASTYGSPGTYAHKVTYTNGLSSPTLAARSFKFELDSTNKYFAWYFLGYQERDRMKITYVSPANNTLTMLEWWEVGAGSGPSNVTTSPKTIQQVYMYKINSLMAFTYAAGDYLLIEITPSANTNTNWEFLCKCLASVDSNIWDGTQRNIVPGSVAMAWNPTTCAYEVTYNKSAAPYTGASTSDLYKYHLKQYRNSGIGIASGTETQTQVKLQLFNRRTYAVQITSAYYSCAALNGSATVNKTGSVLTMVFNNSTDYNQYKNQLASIQANSIISNYDPDNTKLNHYKFFIIYIQKGNSCGDALTTYQFVAHISNPPTFDDGTLTMTWNFAPKTNNYVNTNGSCDDAMSVIQSYCNSANSSASSSTNLSSFTTNVRGFTPYAGGAVTLNSVQNETQKTLRAFSTFPSLDVLNLTTKQWTNQYLPTEQWEFSYIWDRVTITNQADPINNFKLERLMDANGVQITNPANYIKVYEIVNGVVVP